MFSVVLTAGDGSVLIHTLTPTSPVGSTCMHLEKLEVMEGSGEGEN